MLSLPMITVWPALCPPGDARDVVEGSRRDSRPPCLCLRRPIARRLRRPTSFGRSPDRTCPLGLLTADNYWWETRAQADF